MTTYQFNPLALSAARKAAGYSQYTLADATGIARSTIASFEQGVMEPNLSTALMLADRLRINVKKLCKNSRNSV